jgi:hypothetical protein
MDNCKVFNNLKDFFNYCDEIGSERIIGNKAYIDGALVAKYKKVKSVVE